MYMYYFLGELLMNNPNFSDNEKIKAAKNTYLLALDGDVDFKPKAVLLLVDMMKKNEKVGAACGRIHPIGTGPLIWYQKFEYAIAHWLQKATEHVLGCVLCSPGCFSLFRAEALMSDNVMAKYATVSTKARHYLQYDQGEDRWLCTLMLQAGYKVEYNAAADAFTFAPEGYDEFFNQRRRWGPSTMANILDLIMDVLNVIRTNSDMSLLYIIYQAVQFFASIVGPGTIFLMVTGAISVTLNLDMDTVFVVNLIPNVLFIVISFFIDSSLQLKIAKVMTIVYALVMCLVLISIMIDINSNPCSPTSVFFFTVAGVFLLSGILHPQEFSCVLHGVTYYILIPCMYMLLIFYSFININNVSWGTRETVLTAAEQQKAAEKAAMAKVKESKKKSIMNVLSSFWKGGGNDIGETDGHKMACGNICHVVCCPKSSKEKRNDGYWQINEKLDRLLELEYDKRNRTQEEPLSVTSDDDDDDELYDNFDEELVAPRKTSGGILRRTSTRRKKSSRSRVTTRTPRNDLENPFWAEDAEIGNGELQLINEAEADFWRKFVLKYLTPLDKSEEHQDMVTAQLKSLRMNVNFGFFLTNAIFITIVFTLQKHSNELSFRWPCQQEGQPTVQKVEPLSLFFLVFFILVLGIQTLGMITHRLATFWHIMATTAIKAPEKDQLSHWTNIIRNEVQENTSDSSEDDEEDSGSSMGDFDREEEEQQPRNTFNRSTSNLLRRSRREPTRRIIENSANPASVKTNLDDVFKPKWRELADETEENLEERFCKLPGKERRATVRFIKDNRRNRALSENNHSSSQENNRADRVRSPSEGGVFLRNGISANGLERSTNR
ncbi:chitin synthase-like [Watersipora subatra]|uniref:chitin synthase-like n=1 Tax=Watersipora subatra TaxID=2589382 RepID=UPI00355B51E0